MVPKISDYLLTALSLTIDYTIPITRDTCTNHVSQSWANASDVGPTVADVGPTMAQR